MPGLVMPCYTVVRQSTDRVLIHSYLPKFVCFVLFSNDCMAGKNMPFAITHELHDGVGS